MPERKLSYKVDVDTGTAVRDLDKLGKAGGDAGKDIAKGFDQAESASKSALSALSTQMDTVEADAKGLKAAIAAIKANLTVEIDDAKVAQFASDLKGKMGVAFDQVEGDAREFAAVLERGVDLSKTVNEIHGVGNALDHTRGEADQSRSVLANMAGNTTQTLGALGGVVGDLGMGLGQLAEYATDGTISMQGLAKMVGPFAALTAGSLALQSVMKNIAETKAFNADQIKAFSDAAAEAGDTAGALATALDGAFNARVDNDSLWGQLTNAQKTKDLATDLAAVGVTLSDIDGIIRSGASDRASFELLPDVQNLDTILQQAGLGVHEYEAIMDAVFETTQNWTTATEGAGKAAVFFGSSLSTINDAIESQLITENPFARFDQGLFQTGGHLVDLRAIWHDVVDDMRDSDASFDTTAGNVDVLAEAMNMTTDEVIALAREQGRGVKAMADYQQHTKDAADAAEDAAMSFADVGRIVSGTEWDAASIDAAATAMGTFFTDATRGKDAVAGVQGALDDLAEAHHTAGTLLPDLSTGEGRAFMSSLEELGSSLIPEIGDAFDESRGSVDTFNQKMQGLYLRTLAQLSNQLGISTEDAALLLRQIGLTPENFSTMYEMTGTEEAKLQLSLLQGVIEGLPTDVQAQVAYQIKMGDYVGAVNTVVNYGSKHPVVMPGEMDMSGANADIEALRKRTANHPLFIPATVQVTKTIGVGGYKKGDGRSAPAAAADTFGVDAFAAPADTSGGGVSTLVVASPPPPSIVVNLNAGVVGNRYDVSRWVRGALRDQQRLGRVN